MNPPATQPSENLLEPTSDAPQALLLVPNRAVGTGQPHATMSPQGGRAW